MCDFKGNLIKSVKIGCAWSYNAIAINASLTIVGAIGGQFAQTKQVPFEDNIAALSCHDDVCLILLTNGILFKLNISNFNLVKMNPLMINPPEFLSRKSIFDSLSKENCNQMKSNGNEEFFTHIACGRSFSLAVSDQNSVYQIPVKVFTFPSHIKIRKISCGNEHALILTTNGDVYALGSSS